MWIIQNGKGWFFAGKGIDTRQGILIGWSKLERDAKRFNTCRGVQAVCYAINRFKSGSFSAFKVEI